MKIEYIREYLTLVEEMNFTTAAEKRFITQPVLSRHIAALEENLGTRLLNRTTHSIALTSTGKIAAEQFKTLINNYDSLIKTISLMNHGYVNELRIGSLSSMVDSYIDPVLEQLYASFPSNKISLTIREGNELVDDLINDRLDIALFLKVHFSQDDQVRFHKIGHSRWMAMVSEQDPLCNQSSISVQQLKNRTFVFPNVNSDYIDIANSILIAHGVYPKEIIISEQEQTMRYNIKKYQGVALVSEHLQVHAHKSMYFLSFSDEELALDICWAYKITNPNPLIPVLIKLSDKIVENN